MSPFGAVAMTRYVHVAGADAVRICWSNEPPGAGQPESPLTDHCHDDGTVAPEQRSAATIGLPGATLGAEITGSHGSASHFSVYAVPVEDNVSPEQNFASRAR